MENTTGSGAGPLISIGHLTKRYGSGNPALRDLTVQVRRGEALAVLGPSGSGKSTLLNMIAGLDKPDEGTVTVDGVRVDQLGEAGSARYRRATIGMVFQFFNLLDDLTVQDNVLLPAQLAGMGRGESRERALALLADLGVDQYRDTFPGRLSGGERQRVAVARALVNRPPLILADEPTGALDRAAADSVVRLVRDLNERGQTILLVTHDTGLAARCATRTVELVDGRLARHGAAVGE
ncbi:ABC transporter ATP-binding protein [Actinocatenispora thailandica]|uniref:ABC transporter ATP-binding protein n=1 Tax=Actinocatenispora thailandica TaxID=227318 RepID=A0A7R7HZ99_9ACTN|nr:ABC transporter ATP-binding protein [Actinocatenispora thailandica]BCJ37129.1 ABC transporter ATP-binding protein [Actinocatenispora thailandica]